MEIVKKTFGVFALGALMLIGMTSAAIVIQLALSLVIGGSVSAPFTTAITGVSVGTIVDAQTITGANTVAGSDYETVDISITNNANQDINAWLQFSCTSPDNSLTSDFVNVQFDNVASQQKCNNANTVYAYRTFNAESLTALTTTTPEIEYQFPITTNGYFNGDYSCSVDVVVAKVC